MGNALSTMVLTACTSLSSGPDWVVSQKGSIHLPRTCTTRPNQALRDRALWPPHDGLGSATRTSLSLLANWRAD
jgi:hypothetical protein